MVLDEPHGVARFDVLRQHEHAHFRMLGSDPASGHESLVRVRGRHADVDHRDVRVREVNVFHELIRVARLGHDVNPSILAESHDPLSSDHDVFRNHYPHRISTLHTVGSKSTLPPRAPTRSASATIGDVRSEPSSWTVTTSLSSSWARVVAVARSPSASAPARANRMS